MPLLVAWLGLDGDHGLVQGAYEERGSGVRIQGKQWWMVYLDFSAAPRCWARLDAYRWEGWLQLLVENLTLLYDDPASGSFCSWKLLVASRYRR